MSNVYDVTNWTVGSDPSLTAYEDIGAVINDIIANIHSNQTSQDSKPGAVIYIPPGDYTLLTMVTVDVSYLQIKGSGHGFTSRSIIYNSGDTSSWYEVSPGSSHIMVQNTDGNSQAFLVSRGGNPRLSSIEFRDFCLDGVNFIPNENSYTNGKVGIEVASNNDSFRIEGMGFVYLEHAFIDSGADALNVTNNFIAECGNCIELTGSGQASKVTNNLMGAGYLGYSIYAQSHTGLLISGNSIFPRGASMVHLSNTSQSAITGNMFHSFYSGMIDSDGSNDRNLISGNYFQRDIETYSPFFSDNNGHDELYGCIFLLGDNNLISGNYFMYNVPASYITPSGATPTIILVKGGNANQVSGIYVYSNVGVNNIVLDASTTSTLILDSGTSSQILAYTSDYTVRYTPS